MIKQGNPTNKKILHTSKTRANTNLDNLNTSQNNLTTNVNTPVSKHSPTHLKTLEDLTKEINLAQSSKNAYSLVTDKGLVVYIGETWNVRIDDFNENIFSIRGGLTLSKYVQNPDLNFTNKIFNHLGLLKYFKPELIVEMPNKIKTIQEWTISSEPYHHFVIKGYMTTTYLTTFKELLESKKIFTVDEHTLNEVFYPLASRLLTFYDEAKKIYDVRKVK